MINNYLKNMMMQHGGKMEGGKMNQQQDQNHEEHR